jgi:hypothetical protein
MEEPRDQMHQQQLMPGPMLALRPKLEQELRGRFEQRLKVELQLLLPIVQQQLMLQLMPEFKPIPREKVMMHL